MVFVPRGLPVYSEQSNDGRPERLVDVVILRVKLSLLNAK
jgi:hypothetical protein